MYIDKNDLPFFMSNKDWYKFDGEKRIYVPTDKTPPEAIKSMEKFNSEHTWTDEDGRVWSDL